MVPSIVPRSHSSEINTLLQDIRARYYVKNLSNQSFISLAFQNLVFHGVYVENIPSPIVIPN